MRSIEITLTCTVAIASLAAGLFFEVKEKALARPDATVSLTDLAPPHKVRDAVQPPRLRFAIGPQVSHGSSQGGFLLASDYFSGRLGQPVEVVRGRSFGGISTDVRAGDLAVGLMASGPFVLGRREFGFIPLALPIVRGRTSHRSCLVVQAGSEVRTLADLRGQSFAFTDNLSIAGGLVPTVALARFGEKPTSFFGRLLYTHDHDRSIHAVADGVVDGAAVDSLAFDAAVKADPDLQQKVRVVWRSMEFANGPVAVHPRTPPAFRQKLLAILLRMPAEPAGKKVLEQFGLDGFEQVGHEQYKMVEAMLRITGAI